MIEYGTLRMRVPCITIRPIAWYFILFSHLLLLQCYCIINTRKYIRCATAQKNQDRLKWVLSDGRVVSKYFPSTLISVFITRFHHFLYQVATQLSSRGWMAPVSYPIYIENF